MNDPTGTSATIDAPRICARRLDVRCVLVTQQVDFPDQADTRGPADVDGVVDHEDGLVWEGAIGGQKRPRTREVQGSAHRDEWNADPLGVGVDDRHVLRRVGSDDRDGRKLTHRRIDGVQQRGGSCVGQSLDLDHLEFHRTVQQTGLVRLVESQLGCVVLVVERLQSDSPVLDERDAVGLPYAGTRLPQ